MAMSPLAQAISMGERPAPQEQIQPANVLGAYQLASDVAEKNYQAKIAQQNAMWGGLAALGGAGILGFGKPWFQQWLKTQGANAASPAAASSTSAAADTGASGAAGAADAGSAAGGGSVAADLGGSGAAGAGTIAGDYAGASGAGAGMADLGAAGAGGAGSVAADMAAAAPTDVALADTPDFLASFLPFLV